MRSKKNNFVESVSWGSQLLDDLTSGLAKGDFSILETSDYHSGMIALGRFVLDGLENGETGALVTFDSPEAFLENFSLWDIDFQKYLDNEKLFLFHYKPTISHAIGLTHTYNSVFDELKDMAKGKLPDRIAFHQVDSLVNLNSIALMNTCAQKLAMSAKEGERKHSTILGNFIQYNDKTHENLSVAFHKTATGHFSLLKDKNESDLVYNFSTNKQPWYRYEKKKQQIILLEGIGFERADINKLSHTA